jgi:hypothetical protein
MTTRASADCPKFKSGFYNQTTSHVAIAALFYSTSVLDSATVGCFLLLQLTPPLPKENMKPLVDLLSETLLAQLISVYPYICKWLLVA